ncbi:hypothetical protein M9H77_34387 [Catharanthus roseus]|uniref:Uncharacterized protein n=1 Tax=Catharanthus roseus TaxID=4058 RepID=A0ACB9ZL12_CATRO|nr:hypothetical protein M9H77_34387 [Catharanthus roseus]
MDEVNCDVLNPSSCKDVSMLPKSVEEDYRIKTVVQLSITNEDLGKDLNALMQTPFAHCTVESLQLFKAESVLPLGTSCLILNPFKSSTSLNRNKISILRNYSLENKNSIEL